jgi:putative flavoprotein involved in K+ transport
MSSPAPSTSGIDASRTGQGPIETQVVVIGAGPAGLGAAACLCESGADVALLERGDDLAVSWRQAYDSLRLNTSSLFSYLPGRRFPRRLGMWVSRDDLVAYYSAYAASHDLRIHTGVTAARLEQIEGGWEIQTSRGPLRAGRRRRHR